MFLLSDIIEVLHNNKAERIRLSLSGGLLGSLAVSLAFFWAVDAVDRYRRTLADVLLPDGTNVNHARGTAQPWRLLLSGYLC